MKVRLTAVTGYVGVEWDEVVDLPENSTDDEIQDAYYVWLQEHIDMYWEKVYE